MSEAIAQYSLIIFDLDGTLVDLSINWKEVKSELKQTFHLPFQPLFPSFEKLSGSIKKKALQILLKHELRDLANMKPNEKMKHFVRNLVCKNKNLAVFSSNLHQTIECALNNMGLRNSIDIIVGCEDVEKHKPHPEGLLFILKHFKASPSQTVYIGNDSKDFEAAKTSKIKFFYVDQVYPDT